MEIRAKHWVFLAGVLSFLLILPAAALGGRGVTANEIKLGLIADLTGPTVDVQRPYLEGVRNYFRYVNDQGGINGRKITLVPEDDGYNAARAVAAFKKLVTRDEVMAIIGPTGGTQLKANYKQIEEEKVPCIGPMSTTLDQIVPYKRYIFVLNSTYEDQVEIIFDYILKELKGQTPRIALSTQTNEPGVIVERAAKASAEARGIKLAEVVILEPAATSASSQVMLLKRAEPNYIIKQGNIGTAVTLLKDAKQLGLASPFISTSSSVGESLHVQAGDASKHYKSVASINAWYDDAPGIKKMREITLKYEPGTENVIRSRNYVQGWVIGTIVAEGIKRAGAAPDAEKFVDALETLRDFDTQGLCGPITYTSSSHKGLDSARVYECNDFRTGKLTPITDWLRAGK